MVQRGCLEKNILLTGPPGVGKTTMIQKIAERIKQFHPVGFYTSEIREGGIREGFELISLDGRKGLLSHRDLHSPYRVGKYKVDVKGFEKFLVAIPFLERSTVVIVIDEIGKMECLSDKFQELLGRLLDGEKWVIATIALKGTGLIDQVKKRHDIKLFEITRASRGSLLEKIVQYVTGPYGLVQD